MSRRLGAIVVAIAVPVCVLAQATSRTYERQIVSAGAGPQRLAIDAALLAGGAPFRVFRQGDAYYAEGGLQDLRLFADGGRAVPYLLIRPPMAERAWIGGRVLAIASTRKSSGFEVDLGSAQDVDLMRVGGLPAPFLKRLVLEGSGDRAHWTMLAPEATLFDLPDEQLRQDSLSFTPGTYRYLRVTWDDTNSGRVPLPESVSARRSAAVPAPPATTIEASLERRPSEPGRSRFRVKLPAAGLPIVALDLDIPGGHLFRAVTVSEARFSGFEAAPVELGRAILARVTRDGATASALRVPIAAATEPEIDLTIDDGENEPLDVRGVSIVLAQLPWIYFEAPDGSLVARYGDRSLPRPSYDLEAVRGSVNLTSLREAKWADAGPAPSLAAAADAPSSTAPSPGPALDPATFKFARPIEAKSGGLVALPLDAHVLAHSRGAASRFADLRILDADNRQIPFLVERRDEPLSVALTVTPATQVQAAELKPSGSRQQSVYAVPLPYAHLPPGKLVIETRARVFQRSIRIGFDRAPDRRRRDAWFDVSATGTWRHADERTAAQPLMLPIENAGDTDLRLVVDEGDNAALPIASARLLLPSYRLRFFVPRDGASRSFRVLYGRGDLQPPQYDLALLAPAVMGAAATEVSAAAPSADSLPPSRPFVSPRTFWVVLGAAVLVLLALIVRLLKNQDGVNDQGRAAQ